MREEVTRTVPATEGPLRMTRLARLAAAVTLAVAVSACSGGEGPTMPDVDRTPRDEGAGLEEAPPAGEGDAPDGEAEPTPGQSPIDEPDDSQP